MPESRIGGDGMLLVAPFTFVCTPLCMEYCVASTVCSYRPRADYYMLLQSCRMDILLVDGEI